MFDYSVAPLIITVKWHRKNNSITRRSNSSKCSREPSEVYRCTNVRLFGCATHHHCQVTQKKNNSITRRSNSSKCSQIVANVRESLRRFIVARMFDYSVAPLIITVKWHRKNNSITRRSNSSKCSREPSEVYRCTNVRLFGCTTHHHSSDTVKTTQ